MTIRPVVFLITITVLYSTVRAENSELRDLEVSAWPCLNQLEGTAKTPDGQERNRMKNRAAGDLSTANVEQLDTAAFLKKVSIYDGELKANRRTQLNQQQKEQLVKFENQIVSLIGYLVLSYPGPPETTNCGDRNLHDWHLEVFEKSSDHHPEIGDPTPIICEITPRTEQVIYRSGVRLQALSGFFRNSKEYNSTGHPSQLVRVTGYLMWDDEHNGTADVGTTVQYVTAGNGFHHPWRSTAWEIHPVLKMEPGEPKSISQTFPQSTARRFAPTPIMVPTSAPQQFATITKPTVIAIPYGKVTLPVGMRLPVISRSGQAVVVKYLDGNYSIPVESTDVH